jgi:hypothetical protein
LVGLEAPGEEDTVEAAGCKMLETVSAAGDVIEALHLAAHEEKRQAEYQQVGRAGRMGGRDLC